MENYPENLLDKYSEEKEGGLVLKEFENLMDDLYIKLLEPLKCSEELKRVFEEAAGEDKVLNKAELKKVLMEDLKGKLLIYKEGKKKGKKREESLEIMEDIKESMEEMDELEIESEFQKEAMELYGQKYDCKEMKAEAKKAWKQKRGWEERKEIAQVVEQEGTLHMYKTPNIMMTMDLRRFRTVVDEFYADVGARFIEMDWERKKQIFRLVDLDKDAQLSYPEFAHALKLIINEIKTQFHAMQ